MALKQQRARSTRQQKSIGLLACGSSGSWTVDIDETTSGRDRWFAQIEGPSVYLYFEIPTLEIIDQALRFLAEGQGAGGRNAVQVAGNGALALGSDKATQVNLLRDDEFTDRYFLVIESKNGLHLRFTLTGEDLKNVTEALRQAREDIEAE